MVGDEEAQVRAQTCFKCPHNVFPDKGEFLAWSDEIAEAATGGRRVVGQEELGNCEICTCPLRAKVFAKDLKMKVEEREKLPDWCWQKK
jgi:hypothetical protein